MKDRTLYDTLNIKPNATAAEIKQAYRRLVLRYHPDTSKEPNASEIFIEITEAYQALNDPERRREYDRILALRKEIDSKRRQPAAPPPGPTQPDPKTKRSSSQSSAKATQARTIHPDDVSRMVKFVSSGRLLDAEEQAKKLLDIDGRHAVSYAVLADVYRGRGELREAYRYSAFAVQFAPHNATFLRKHEELLDALERRDQGESSPVGTTGDGSWVAAFIGVILCVVAASYVALSPERPVFDRSTVISTYTMGLVGASLASGAILAACLSMSDLVDRLEAVNAFGRVSSTFIFMLLSIINIWIAGIIYILVAGFNRSFILTLSRMFAAIGLIVVLMTMAAALTRYIDPYQVMLYSGSFVSLGAIFGWAFADSFKS